MTLTFKIKLAFKLAKYLFKLCKLTHLNFTFTNELFIDHKVLDEFETSDLDLQDSRSNLS